MNSRIFKATAVLVALAPAVPVAGAELAHNPFSRPPSNIVATESDTPGRERQPVRPLELRATMIAGRSGLANVDGRILRPGEEIDGYRLERVYEDRAVFSRAGKPITVYVKPQLVNDND
jgi:hypothetical protein